MVSAPSSVNEKATPTGPPNTFTRLVKIAVDSIAIAKRLRPNEAFLHAVFGNFMAKYRDFVRFSARPAWKTRVLHQ